MNKVLLPILLFFIVFYSKADETDSTSITTDTSAFKDIISHILQIDTSFQKGVVEIGDRLAKISVPEGYKFLNAELSRYVLEKLWGNPPSEATLGMLFPDSAGVAGDEVTYGIEITYSEDGHIDDEDAKDLDYNELLKQMQKEAEDANEERVRMGYKKVHLIGWATPPFYDDQTKKLHYAKEIKFEGDSANTLNYNIQILGRKGLLNMNVIGDMSILPEVKKNINKVLASVNFNDGNKYSDFNPDVDEVAAYGIGGLIAGKLLAKAGFFAVILKFWKIIAVAVVGFFGAIWKKFFGGKTDQTS